MCVCLYVLGGVCEIVTDASGTLFHFLGLTLGKCGISSIKY